MLEQAIRKWTKESNKTT